MSKASLKLFGVVPERYNLESKYLIIPEYGVLVTPGASHDVKNILAHLKENGVGISEQNSAFYSNWKTVRDSSDLELILDQILHYFSTYGLESLEIDSVKNALVYVPNNVLHLNIPVALKLVESQPELQIIKRCFSLLDSGMALTQETIESVIYVLQECGYQVTGEENIKNKEAEILFIEASGILPKESTKLFRYIFYKMSDKTMVINDKATIQLINSHGRRLPVLSQKDMVTLSESFNRYRELWMAMKTAHSGNRHVVNQISKLSKKNHVPMPQNILNNLTSGDYSHADVSNAAKKAGTFQLVRAINALRLRQQKLNGAVYRIRNGKLWTSLFGPSNNAKNIEFYEEILMHEIRERFSKVVAYAEPFVDYPIVTSEKNFIGNVPDGTILRFNSTWDTFLVGIHWTSAHTDLDLRANSRTGSIGWNASKRTSGRNLMYSGDMTRAPGPHGASEWLYCSGLDTPYNIQINKFHSYDFSGKFKLIFGQSKKSRIEMGYIIHPDEVIYSCGLQFPEDRQLDLGILFPDGNNICFMFGMGTTGNGRVGGWNKYSGVQQEIADKKVQTALRLRDVIRFTNSPEEATIDLSLSSLTKDSFLGIFK